MMTWLLSGGEMWCDEKEVSDDDLLADVARIQRFKKKAIAPDSFNVLFSFLLLIIIVREIIKSSLKYAYITVFFFLREQKAAPHTYRIVGSIVRPRCLKIRK